MGHRQIIIAGMPRAAIRAPPITNRMQNRWDSDADRRTTPLALLAYGSRLLGSEPLLVLHGGGNTSLKQRENGRTVLYVKGSARRDPAAGPHRDARDDVGMTMRG